MKIEWMKDFREELKVLSNRMHSCDFFHGYIIGHSLICHERVHDDRIE